MKCPSCKNEIPEGSVFCPDCGISIDNNVKDYVPESIRHLGHLDLIPTSMEKWKWPNSLEALCFLLPILFVVIWFTPWSPRKKKLSEVADYVEKYNVDATYKMVGSKRVIEKAAQKYAIFVKNGKCGVLDVYHFKVSVDAKFDTMSWREKDKYLMAYLNGKPVVVDVKGTILK